MKENDNDILLVGIASSAGGLEPMRDLIENAICHKDMAYILVPHLSKDYESNLDKIFKRVTSLTVCPIKDGMEIRACHLYILPPNYYARVEGRNFVLDERTDKINHAADHLFLSLAKNYGENAIGVILSGANAGADGSAGVTAIKKSGGHTYAQDPETAIFRGMPDAAIATGNIDSVLTTSQIGHDLSLLSWVGHT